MAKRRIKRSRHRFPLMASEQLYRRPIQIIASSGHRALWFSALNLIFFRGKCRTPNAMTLGSYCFVGNLQVLFFATRIVAPSRKGSVRIGIQSRPASRSSRGAPGSGTLTVTVIFKIHHQGVCCTKEFMTFRGEHCRGFPKAWRLNQ